MREKVFIGLFVDGEGVTHEVIFQAASRRRAKCIARDWLERTGWDATFVGIGRASVPGVQRVSGRRLLATAGVTFAVSGVTIAAMMIIGLSLEGAV